MHQVRDDDKTHNYHSIKQWPDSKYTANVKCFNINCFRFIFFIEEKISNQKTAEYEKEIYSIHPISCQCVTEVPQGCFFDCIDLGIKTVCKKNSQKSKKAQTIKVWKKYFF